MQRRRTNTRTANGLANQFYNDVDEEGVLPLISIASTETLQPCVSFPSTNAATNIQTTPTGSGSPNGSTPGTGSYQFTNDGQVYDSWCSEIGTGNPTNVFDSSSATTWLSIAAYTGTGSTYTGTKYTVGTDGVQYFGEWVEIGFPSGVTLPVDGILMNHNTGTNLTQRFPSIYYVFGCADSTRAQYELLLSVSGNVISPQTRSGSAVPVRSNGRRYKTVRVVFNRTNGFTITQLNDIRINTIQTGQPWCKFSYNGTCNEANTFTVSTNQFRSTYLSSPGIVYAYNGAYLTTLPSGTMYRQLQVTQGYYGDWMQYEFSHRVRCTGYRIQTGTGTSNYISKWVLLGSNDQIVWEVVDDRTRVSSTVLNTANRVDLRTSRPAEARFFRLVVTEVAGGTYNSGNGLGGTFVIQLFQLLGISTSNRSENKLKSVSNRNAAGSSIVTLATVQPKRTVNGLQLNL